MIMPPDSIRRTGLTLADIITFHQLIGFIIYQACIIAGIYAFRRQHVRWLRRRDINPDAPFVAIEDPYRWH
ncbi:hypothetical protein [Izhakiella capsodis]|uniref:hypothetical protein n=1 Tax=Izhakiella capsodis TaxID=1367852 RepID=UPI001160A3AA|nr:hypothetical protein [Izhakiella capsodis]